MNEFLHQASVLQILLKYDFPQEFINKFLEGTPDGFICVNDKDRILMELDKMSKFERKMAGIDS